MTETHTDRQTVMIDRPTDPDRQTDRQTHYYI